MVRMDRRGGSWKLLGSVMWAHRQVCDTFVNQIYYQTKKSTQLQYAEGTFKKRHERIQKYMRFYNIKT